MKTKKGILNKGLSVPFEAPINISKSYEDEGKWFIEGYATTSDIDLQGDIISEEAIKASEKDLLENSTMFYDHKTDVPIGKIIESRAEKEGLFIKGLISKTVPEVWQQVQEEVLNKFSVRGRVNDAVKEFVSDIGRTARVIKSMYLLECSLVPLPANPGAKSVGWYIEKSLDEFEAEGGEIPMKKNQENGDEQKTDEQQTDNQNADNQNVDSQVNDSQQSNQDEGKTDGEQQTDNAEGSQNDDGQQEVSGSEESNTEEKQDDTAKKYTQQEVDVLLSKAKHPLEEAVKKLEAKVKDMEADGEVNKQWNEKYSTSYAEEDADAIKGIIKKSILGVTLSADETMTLIDRKITPSGLPGATTPIMQKGMTEEKRAELIKLGNLRVPQKR